MSPRMLCHATVGKENVHTHVAQGLTDQFREMVKAVLIEETQISYVVQTGEVLEEN